jgi:hypothetical protein
MLFAIGGNGVLYYPNYLTLTHLVPSPTVQKKGIVTPIQWDAIHLMAYGQYY